MPKDKKKKNNNHVLLWELMCDKKHKITETYARSLLKGITGRILEVLLDAFVFSFFIPIETSLGLAVFVEVSCFIVNFVNERGWNRIQWGRKIKHEGKN